MRGSDVRWVGGDRPTQRHRRTWRIFNDADYDVALKSANVGDLLQVPIAYEVAVLLPIGGQEHEGASTKERFVYTLGSGRSWHMTPGQKYIQVINQKRPKGSDRRYILEVRVAADKPTVNLLMGEELTVHLQSDPAQKPGPAEELKRETARVRAFHAQMREQERRLDRTIHRVSKIADNATKRYTKVISLLNKEVEAAKAALKEAQGARLEKDIFQAESDEDFDPEVVWKGRIFR